MPQPLRPPTATLTDEGMTEVLRGLPLEMVRLIVALGPVLDAIHTGKLILHFSQSKHEPRDDPSGISVQAEVCQTFPKVRTTTNVAGGENVEPRKSA
jgi:hypothetical protein